MPQYDSSNFNPPAPVSSVSLRNIDTKETVPDVPLLIDTGADVTLLPRVVVDKAEIPVLTDQQFELLGFDGNKGYATAVIAVLIFLNRAYRGRYLLIDEAYGILGRDVLNHVKVVLDGPNQQWSESKK